MTQVRARVLTAVWALVLLALHAIPRSGLERVPGAGRTIATVGADKLVHAGMFVVFGFLGSAGFPRRPRAVAAAGVAYGAALEVFQSHLVVGRTGSAADLLADAAGMGLGLGLAAWTRRRRKPAGPAGRPGYE